MLRTGIPSQYVDGWFWSGAPEPSWLSRFDVPLFVSHSRIAARCTRRLPRARGAWACDSGAFSVLAKHGAYPPDAPKEYAEALQRYREEIGGLIWAAPQDWMCEPWVLKRTGLSVTEHQHRSCASVCQMRALAPSVHIIPVLQGYAIGDYEAHTRMYCRYGIDLPAEPLVGLGSVCRRQATRAIRPIVSLLRQEGIRLHGFGVSLRGLRQVGQLLASADSQAGLITARRASGAMPGTPHHIHPRGGAKCTYCPVWLLGAWRTQALRAMCSARQTHLFDRRWATRPPTYS